MLKKKISIKKSPVWRGTLLVRHLFSSMQMCRMHDVQAFHKNRPFLCRIYSRFVGLSILSVSFKFSSWVFQCRYNHYCLFDWNCFYHIGIVANCVATHSNYHITIIRHKSRWIWTHRMSYGPINRTIFRFKQFHRVSFLEKYKKETASISIWSIYHF